MKKLNDFNKAAFKRKYEFKLPLALVDSNVKLNHYKKGTDFAGCEEKIRSEIFTIL